MDKYEVLKILKARNIITENRTHNYRLWKSKENKILRQEIESLEIPELNSFFEKFWHIINEFKERPKCEHCGSLTNFLDISSGFRRFCSKKCLANSDFRKEKTKQTSLQKYGVEHPTQSQQYRNTIAANIEKLGYHPGGAGTPEHKKAIQEKYGVDNPFQSKLIKNKIKITNNERYGVDNPQKNPKIRKQMEQTKLERYGTCGWNPSEVKKTCQAKYGVDNPLQSPKIREKIKATCLERYGVEHAIQDPEIFEKCQQAQTQARYKYKEKILPSGKKIYYQGYEGYVIDYILQTKLVEENDIENERFLVPIIPYVFNNKKRIYFPDIYIKSKKMLIEVKSTYTYAREIDKNLAKQKASNDLGFVHIIIIWNVKNNWIEDII